MLACSRARVRVCVNLGAKDGGLMCVVGKGARNVCGEQRAYARNVCGGETTTRLSEEVVFCDWCKALVAAEARNSSWGGCAQPCLNRLGSIWDAVLR